VGALRVAGIPANYVPLIQKAGTVSPEFPAPVIAAQLSQESNFSDPTSSTGAQGPAQFEPATWQTWGKDTTGKGYADVHNPSDAIDAQARFDAALAGQVRQAQASGQIHSSASVTEMALGAYNAGFGAVLASGWDSAELADDGVRAADHDPGADDVLRRRDDHHPGP